MRMHRNLRLSVKYIFCTTRPALRLQCALTCSPSTGTQVLLPWREVSASKPLEAKTARCNPKLQQLSVWLSITLLENRLSEPLGPLSTISRFSCIEIELHS